MQKGQRYHKDTHLIPGQSLSRIAQKEFVDFSKQEPAKCTQHFYSKICNDYNAYDWQTANNYGQNHGTCLPKEHADE